MPETQILLDLGRNLLLSGILGSAIWALVRFGRLIERLDNGFKQNSLEHTEIKNAIVDHREKIGAHSERLSTVESVVRERKK